MDDEPRFLREGTAAPDNAAVVTEPASGPSPEQIAAATAYLEGRHPIQTQCATCKAGDVVPVYTLVENSVTSTHVGATIRTDTLVLSLAPRVFPLCQRCYWRCDELRCRARRARRGAIAGLVLAGGYFVAALAGASTPIALGLLFGGIALTVGTGTIAVRSDRALVAALSLRNGVTNTDIVVMSLDRGDVERVLERRQLASLEMSNELERQARGMSALPVARIEPSE